MKNDRQKLLPDGLTLLKTLRIDFTEARFQEIDWSSDGRWVSAHIEPDNWDESYLRVYEIEGDEEFDLQPGDYADLFCHVWSPDGKCIATGSEDLHIFDVGTQQVIRHVTIDRDDEEESVVFVAWTEDGQRIVTGGDQHRWGGGPIYIFEAATGGLVHEMSHRNRVTSFALSPDGQTLVTTGAMHLDTYFRVWDVQTGACINQWPMNSRRVRNSKFSPDGNTLVVTSHDDGEIHFMDVQTGERTRVLQGHTDKVIATSFSHDGRLMLSDSVDGTVRIWRCDAWQTVATLPVTHVKQTWAEIKFHPTRPILGVIDDQDTAIHLIEFNEETLFSVPSIK